MPLFSAAAATAAAAAAPAERSLSVSAPVSVQVYLGAAVLADIMKDKPDFWISKQEWCGRRVNVSLR